MDISLQKMFANIVHSQHVIIVFRCSPTHKGQTVEFIKTNSVFGNPVTMAVGDGANDVCMIQKADIGIGI